MSIPAWPSNLPQYVLSSGYGSSAPDVLLRSSMEAGPAKVRRRASAGAYPIKGRIQVTSAELDDLKTFFNDTLLGGALRFTWVDPIDQGTSVEMRFTDVPTWTPVDNDLFEIDLSLEVLP